MDDEWKISLIQKDAMKSIAHNTYRPITCLPMIWEILTQILGPNIRKLTILHKVLPTDDIERLYETRKRGRRLPIIEPSVDTFDVSKTTWKSAKKYWFQWTKSKNPIQVSAEQK